MTKIDPCLVPKTGFAHLDMSNNLLAETGTLIVELAAAKSPDCKSITPLLQRFLELGNQHIENESSYLKLAGNHQATWRRSYFRSVLVQLAEEMAACQKTQNALSTAMVSRLVEEWLYEHFCNSPYLEYKGEIEYPCEEVHLLHA